MLQFLDIQKDSRTPIYRQIENQFREAILAGIIKPGLRLPASRALALELGVSRPTIVQVYEYLALEGFFEARPGSGTFVSRVLPDFVPQKIVWTDEHATNDEVNTKPLSIVGEGFRQINSNFDGGPLVAFLPNVPAFDHFPHSRWRKIRKSHIETNSTHVLGYEQSAGYEPLRRAIAEYLAIHRGDPCDPEQILIVPGSHFAFHLATLLLSNPGDKVWLEDPGADNVRVMLKAMGRNIANIDVDRDGMDVADEFKRGEPVVDPDSIVSMKVAADL